MWECCFTVGRAHLATPARFGKYRGQRGGQRNGGFYHPLEGAIRTVLQNLWGHEVGSTKFCRRGSAKSLCVLSVSLTAVAITCSPLIVRRAGGSLTGEKKRSVPLQQFLKRPRVTHVFNCHGLAVGGWWRLAVGGWWQVAFGDWWLVAVDSWWRLSVWLQLVVGSWRLVAVGSNWRLAVGGSWRLAAVGGWRLGVPKGGP